MFLIGLTSGAVTAAVVIALLPVLRRITIDVPNHRSSHSTPTPRGGGLAIMAGLVAGHLAAVIADDPTRVVVSAVVLAAGLVGFADDVRPRSAAVRFSAIMALSALACWSIIEPDNVAGYAAVAIAMVFVTGYTNSFNFMDGINGISSLNTVVVAGWFTWVAIDSELGAPAALALMLAAAALAFAPFNLPRAVVFLGDSGSYGIGVAIAVLAVWLVAEDVDPLVVMAPLVVYVADTSITFFRRRLAGHSWNEAHREHAYQRLVDRGYTHTRATLVTVAASLVVCASTLSAHSEVVAPLVATTVIAVYLWLPVAGSRRSDL